MLTFNLIWRGFHTQKKLKGKLAKTNPMNEKKPIYGKSLISSLENLYKVFLNKENLRIY